MKLFNKLIGVLSVCGIAAMTGCGNNIPLLTEMETNRLVVIIKGTYESNSPQPWEYPDPNIPPSSGGLVQDDSVVIVQSPPSPPDVYPTAFMLDLSELRLLDTKGHSLKFSNVRQTFAMGLNNAEPFFNGVGVLMQNDDVPTTQYPAVMIYVRKMLFDNAIKYIPTSTWSPLPFLDSFSERLVPGFNFNQFQSHSNYDVLRYESYLYNRVFPIIVSINDPTSPFGMTFTKEFPVTVLEIRFVVKNFIKKFEVVNNTSSENQIFGYVHFYAFSDWLQDVQPDETTLGGNLLTVARSYIPGLTGSIHGTNGTAHPAHVIAIPHGEDIANYTIPNANLRGNNPCNMPRPPSVYLGQSISDYLDYQLKLQKFRYDWNLKFGDPSTWPAASVAPDCASFSGSTAGGSGATLPAYTEEWNTYAREVGRFKIPPLAVWVDSPGSYTIENVMPGSYDLYISDVPITGTAPYGELYIDNQFIPYINNPVNVSIGGRGKDPANNTSIDF
jgi:hypothetical protein